MAINSTTSRAIYRWRPACWLHVTGEDAANFLQGQFTNDLRMLENSPAVYGLWLSVKGKVLADSFVLRGGSRNEFWIGSYFSPATVIRERLESHVIADDVVIEDVTSTWAGISLLGFEKEELSTLRSADGFIFTGRRDRNGSVEWVRPADQPEPPELQATDAVVIGDTEIAQRRIAAGIPAIPMDVGPADLPNEAGLEEEAISYTKGCYLGQEVMARLKSMGQVRRRLWRVRGQASGVATLPAPVFAGARQVGELRSAVGDDAGGWMGFAMVSLIHVKPGDGLSFAANGPAAMRLNPEP